MQYWGQVNVTKHASRQLCVAAHEPRHHEASCRPTVPPTVPHAWQCPAHLMQTRTAKRRHARSQRPVTAAPEARPCTRTDPPSSECRGWHRDVAHHVQDVSAAHSIARHCCYDGLGQAPDGHLDARQRMRTHDIDWAPACICDEQDSTYAQVQVRTHRRSDHLHAHSPCTHADRSAQHNMHSPFRRCTRLRGTPAWHGGEGVGAACRSSTFRRGMWSSPT